MTDVSTSFPDATLRLLIGIPKGERALELGEVQADNLEQVTDSIRTHEDISEYDQLYEDDRRTIGQYEAHQQNLNEFLYGSSVPPEFPIIVENGEMEFSLTVTQDQFDALRTTLDERGQTYELLTLVRTNEDPVLTPRQRSYLTVAYRHGYFEVPRECTLEEVAETLDVDKSSASGTIRRAVERIIGQFIVRHDQT